MLNEASHAHVLTAPMLRTTRPRPPAAIYDDLVEERLERWIVYTPPRLTLRDRLTRWLRRLP